MKFLVEPLRCGASSLDSLRNCPNKLTLTGRPPVSSFRNTGKSQPLISLPFFVYFSPFCHVISRDCSNEPQFRPKEEKKNYEKVSQSRTVSAARRRHPSETDEPCANKTLSQTSDEGKNNTPNSVRLMTRTLQVTRNLLIKVTTRKTKRTMMTNFTAVGGEGELLKKKMECQRKNITSDYQGVIRDQTGTAKKGQNFSSVTARPSASVAVVPRTGPERKIEVE